MKGSTTMAKNFNAYTGVNRKRRNIDRDLRNLSGANVRDIDFDDFGEVDDWEPFEVQSRFPLHSDD